MPQLTWLGDAQAKRIARQVPYRLLDTVSVHGDADAPNCLIQGDNLDALKALLPFYAGRVKCIFIDPPYNTKSAFEHYDDNLEHSQWLSMMYPRLELLRDLLAEDGSIWVTIDDNEAHYLKVMMDEVFGRGNFVANVVWQKKYAVASDAKGFSDFHDHIFVYTKNKVFARNLLPRSEKQDSLYKYDDHDGNGSWRTDNLSVKTYSEAYNYPLTNPKTGKEYWPPKGRCWYTSSEKMQTLLNSNGIYFGKDGIGAPQLKRYLARVQNGVVPSTWWTHEDAGHNDESRKESKVLFVAEDPFSTPKPERLIQRILQIATNLGDLVLDSFLGSATSAAVAHKMGRRWIGIEMGKHAHTHCLPRLQKVVDGEQGGISKAVDWNGGGGFRFMKLGEPAFQDDGQINPEIRFGTLANYLWFLETGVPHTRSEFDTPLLGIVGEGESAVAYLLLYNGILGDRRPESGNVLTSVMWPYIQNLAPEHKGRWVIYGEAARMPESRRRALSVSFKQIPYDIRMK